MLSFIWDYKRLELSYNQVSTRYNESAISYNAHEEDYKKIFFFFVQTRRERAPEDKRKTI